jgi:lipoprotein-anchoring transpeptidase ErfK/SrfK
VTRRLGVLAAAALTAAAVLLTGCSSASTGGSPAAAPSAVTAHSSPAPSRPVPRAVAAAKPKVARPANPCAKNDGAQLVRVSIHQQHLWMCTRHHVAYSTPITSGMVGQYTSTPTGNYTVQGLDRDTQLTLLDGQTFAVKYWIPFSGPLFGFHDASWQNFAYGSQKYRKHGSHGCVHMPLKAIAFLYHWAKVGATVRIRS